MNIFFKKRIKTSIIIRQFTMIMIVVEDYQQKKELGHSQTFIDPICITELTCFIQFHFTALISSSLWKANMQLSIKMY